MNKYGAVNAANVQQMQMMQGLMMIMAGAGTSHSTFGIGRKPASHYHPNKPKAPQHAHGKSTQQMGGSTQGAQPAASEPSLQNSTGVVMTTGPEAAEVKANLVAATSTVNQI